MVMIEVVLVLETPTPLTRKFILTQTGMMGCSGHLRYIGHNNTWCNIGVGIVHLVILVVLHLVFVMVMVKVVLVL